MKIKQEHFDHMKAAICANAKAPTLYAYTSRGLTEMRWRWDLCYQAGLSKWICDNLYSYMDDTHIDTALRNITGGNRG